MRKNKKWIVLLIVLFPSMFWIILESSTINSRKLPYYGPKKVVSNDTVFYSVNTEFKKIGSDTVIENFDTTSYPILALMFVKDNYKAEAYRISGFWEHVNYKKDKIKHIPFVLVCETKEGRSETRGNIVQMSKNVENIYFTGWNKHSFDSLNKVFFAEKPYYVDYSFFILLDKKRNIRGYYDARYVAEIKRLIDEYQHLRIKEEKNTILKENEIKTKSS